MCKRPYTAPKSQAGFTLVELAVVMIIIGLLIGGVLKGQELIANAQIAATVSQLKAFEAGITTFRDTFNGVPGDLLTPGTRIPNCAGACAVAGNGNLHVDSAFNAAPTAEGIAFWQQLSAADLITGINPANGAVWGGMYPEAKIGGGYAVVYEVGGAVSLGRMPGVQAAAGNIRNGHYLALYDAPGAAVPTTGVITPSQAYRIDAKIDDNAPGSGSVLAGGAAAGATGCSLDATRYNEVAAVTYCNLYIRIQN